MIACFAFGLQILTLKTKRQLTIVEVLKSTNLNARNYSTAQKCAQFAEALVE